MCHLPLHMGGLSEMEPLSMEFPQVPNKKAPLCKGSSREAGEGLFLLSFSNFYKLKVCLNNSSHTGFMENWILLLFRKDLTL